MAETPREHRRRRGGRDKRKEEGRGRREGEEESSSEGVAGQEGVCTQWWGELAGPGLSPERLPPKGALAGSRGAEVGGWRGGDEGEVPREGPHVNSGLAWAPAVREGV